VQVERAEGLHEVGGHKAEREKREPCVARVGECFLRSERHVGLRMGAGIRLIADVEVAAAKDRCRGGDEVLLKCPKEKQRFKDGSGGVDGLGVAGGCEDFAGLLVKNGCDCGRATECVGEGRLFPSGRCGQCVGSAGKKGCGCGADQECGA
jgi:hypothetical protein